MAESAELATAWLRLVPSLDGLTDNITKGFTGADSAVTKAGDSSGKKWSKAAGAAALIGVAALTAGVVKVFNTGIEELKFGEQINAQTDLLIKNTGFTMATEQINDYTLALSKVSGVSEEDLQAAGNNILKFGNVSEENYKKAVASINDLAASGKDATSVSEGLGKALADPATAAGKLRRMGINLTEQQEAQIKAMVEAGDVAGAQTVILDSLEQTYGGMAEAAGGTLEGNLNKLNNAFENLSGDLVSAAMPAISGIVEALQGFVGWLSENQAVVPIFAAIVGVTLVGAFIAWAASVWAANAALLANPITWIILAVIALIAAVVALVMNWDAVVAWITEVWDGFISWITGVMDGFVGWWNGVWDAVVAWATTVWEGFISWITGVIDGFVGWWNDIWAAVGAWIAGVWQAIVAAVQGAWNAMWSWITGVVAGFLSWWSGAWGKVADAWESIWDGIGSFVEGIWDGIVSYIKRYINNIIRLINGIIDGINSVSGAIGDALGLSLRIPNIPMLAKGGTITSAGSVIVGENGPELLHLPRGASVNPDIRGGGTGEATIAHADMLTLAAMVAAALRDVRSADTESAVLASARGVR